jgi:hypothetical protein
MNWLLKNRVVACRQASSHGSGYPRMGQIGMIGSHNLERNREYS